MNEAVRELGYRPHLGARHMKSGKSRQIGVLVRNNSRTSSDERGAHPLAYEFVLGISEGLEEAGYLMSFVRLSDVEPEKHTQNSAFQGHLLDGLIVVNDVPAASPERLDRLVPHCVWVDNIWQPLNCIRRDEFGAGELTARHVAAAGYKKWLILLPENALQPGEHYSFDAAFGRVAKSGGGNRRDNRDSRNSLRQTRFFPAVAAVKPRSRGDSIVHLSSVFAAARGQRGRAVSGL